MLRPERGALPTRLRLPGPGDELKNLHLAIDFATLPPLRFIAKIGG